MTNLGSFEYSERDSSPYSDNKKSSDLATAAIGWFMLGYNGFQLPSNAIVYDRDNNRNEDFYEKFKGQIKDLIKREVKNGGSYTIYYS